MGRPRTPTAILETKGAFIKDPQRKRPNEPTTDNPIGSPPPEFSKEEKKRWKQLVQQSLPGVLKESDRLLFAVLAKLAAKFYAGDKMLAAEVQQMINIASRFALTPADRSKVAVDAPKKSSLQDFIARKTPPIARPSDRPDPRPN